MKTSKLFGSALLAISLCFSACDEIRTQTGINADLDGDGIIDGTNPSDPSDPSDPSNPPTPSIRPYKIDMAGVQGFAIVENTSNAPRTKADTNGDGVDDDMPNGNGSDMGSESVNTSPYALYTIDENGELHVSIFYFEVVQSEGDSTDVSYTEVLNEVSNALQIVPSLVTDLGKYILFSGCEYQIITSDISDEALSICQAYISENTRWDMTYMIRKSDGGLFDFTAEKFFCYKGSQIPAETYITSVKGNLFVMSPDKVILKFEDNGKAIDVKQMTQIDGPSIERFIVDKDENIYLFCRYKGKPIMDIYYANGGFNAYEFEPSFANTDLLVLDLITDESGISYIFLISDCMRETEKTTEDGQTYLLHEMGQLVLSARVTNGIVETMSETYLLTNKYRPYYDNDGTENHCYLGYYNNCHNWCLRYVDPEASSSPYKILSYDISTHICTLKEVSAGLNQILVADYDAFLYGSKTYCANVKGNTIEVTEVDWASETSRTYSLSVDMPTIVTPTYMALMIQNVPYLTIDGRNTANGANVSITVNLINGETNSSFAQDGRNVVSFFRIN